MATVLTLIQDAVAAGLNLPRDPIQDDVFAEALARYDKCGKVVFDAWPWDNRKILPATYTPDSDGIITLDATVDIVRAVRPIGTGGTAGRALWPESEINAAIRGETVSSARFIPLPDDDDGNRRIQVNADDDVASYSVLAMRRFVEAVNDDAYDATSPTATPTDYRVLEWLIDHAQVALVAYMADELREWDGRAMKGDWQGLLAVAISKCERQTPREFQVVVPNPLFGELGDWL